MLRQEEVQEESNAVNEHEQLKEKTQSAFM